MKKTYTIRLTGTANGRPVKVDSLHCVCESIEEVRSQFWWILSHHAGEEGVESLRVLGADDRHLHLEYSLIGISISEVYNVEMTESLLSTEW